VSLRESGRPTAAAPDLDPELRRMLSRQRWGVINRRLGWVILPMVVVATAVHFGPGGPGATHDPRHAFVVLMQWVYAPLAAVHGGISFYVFGWVEPRRTLRVFHIWFGYAYAVLIVASQTSWAFPTAHGLLTMAMFAALTAHVAIGIHYARRRRRAGLPRAQSSVDPVAPGASGR
jgi:hypothetical protein